VANRVDKVVGTVDTFSVDILPVDTFPVEIFSEPLDISINTWYFLKLRARFTQLRFTFEFIPTSSTSVTTSLFFKV